MSVVTRHRKHGKTYYVKVLFDGKEYWEPAGRDKRFARSLNAQRKQEVRDGTYQPKTSANPTVGEYCRDWMGKRKVRSREDEERCLEMAVHSRPWLANLRMLSVRGLHAHQLIDELEAIKKRGPGGKVTDEAISVKYAANIYGVVSRVFAEAERRELIPRNPFRALPRKRLKRRSKSKRSIYTLDAMPKLVAGAEVHPSARMFAGLSFFLGTREGETCGLTFADWDQSAAPLTAMRVNKQYDGRLLKTDEQEEGEHERIVPIHPVLEGMLRAWWERGFQVVHCRAPMPSDPIVPAQLRGPSRRKSAVLDVAPNHHTKSSAYKMWRKACDVAGVANVSLHSTRHTFITLACRRSLKEVVETLTHNAKGETIDIYNHKQWGDLCQVVALIDLAPTVAPQVTLPVTPVAYLLTEGSNVTPEPCRIQGGEEVATGKNAEDAPTRVATETPQKHAGLQGATAKWDARHPSDRDVDLLDVTCRGPEHGRPPRPATTYARALASIAPGSAIGGA